MRWTLAATLAAALAGAGWTSPAARADDDCGRVEMRRVEVRRPAVRLVIGGHSGRCAWRPARYEDRVERVVLRDGYWREESVPATVGVRFDFGCRRFVRVVLRPSSVSRTWVPPVYGERVVRVLVPGRWDCACD